MQGIGHGGLWMQGIGHGGPWMQGIGHSGLWMLESVDRGRHPHFKGLRMPGRHMHVFEAAYFACSQ